MMSNNRINIDNLFRSKLIKRKFDDGLEDWKAMEQLLNEGDKRKRRILPLFWLAAGMTISALLGFVLLKSNNATNPAQPIKIDTPDIILEANNGFAQNTDPLFNENKKIDLTNVDNQESHDRANQQLTVEKPNSISPKTQLELEKKSHHSPDVLKEGYPRKNGDELENDLSSNETSLNYNAPIINVIELTTPRQNMDKISSHIKLPLLPKMTTIELNSNLMEDDLFEPHLNLGLGGGLMASQDGISGFNAGLLGDYHINQHWLVQTGFQFMQQNLGSLYSKLREDVSYQFGTVTKVYGMNAQSIAYGSVPMSVLYKIKKNQFGLGVATDFIFGVKGEIQEIELMQSTERSKIKEVKSIVQSGWIDMSPFNKTNTRFMLNYRRELLPTLFIGTNASYNLASILTESPDQLDEQKTSRLFLGLNIQMFLK